AERRVMLIARRLHRRRHVQTDSGASSPLAERWDGRAWTRQATPPRRRTDAGLTGVSCPAATDCFAVGAAGDGSRTLIERWTHHKWRILASGSGRAGFLRAIACSSPAACTAVGSTSSGRALAERWNGTRWAVQHLPSPPASWLTGISCPSQTDCTAVGNATPGGGQPFAEHWNKGSWKLQRIPDPTGF